MIQPNQFASMNVQVVAMLKMVFKNVFWIAALDSMETLLKKNVILIPKIVHKAIMEILSHIYVCYHQIVKLYQQFIILLRILLKHVSMYA